MTENFLTLDVTLSEEELDVLKTILEDTLHQHTEVASIEDAVIRGVLSQLIEQFEIHCENGGPWSP